MIIRVIPAGDLLIQNRQLVFFSGTPFYRQKIASRFKMFLGEWFLDKRQGVPYYRDIFKKDPDLGVVRSVFRKVLIETPGVLSADRFAVDWTRKTRELGFDFEATATTGIIVIRPSDRLFIVAP